MRLAAVLAVTALSFTPALAADYLRGPLPEPAAKTGISQSWDWSGYTVSVHGLWGTGTADQSGLANSVTNATFPDLAATSAIAGLVNFGTPTLRGSGYGFAFGYNTQFDDVVLGLEGEYNRASMTADSAFGPVARRLATTGTTQWDTTVSGSARTRVRDYGVLRARVGAAFDRFLPFVSAGLVVGRFNSTASMSGTTQEMQLYTDPNTNVQSWIPLSGVLASSGSVKTSGYSWGYAVGAGLDVAITDAIFARGQWEYLGIGGASNVNIGLHTFKGGIGARF